MGGPVSKFIPHLISPDIPLSTIRLQPSSLLLLIQKQPCWPHPVMLGMAQDSGRSRVWQEVDTGHGEISTEGS